jgi:hypothetical protein
MVQHVLLPVNIHFHGNILIFEFLTIVLIFILVAILKILKTKSTTLSNDLFLCQVSKGRNNIHINKPKKSESVGQTLPQLPWKQKKGDLKKIDSFHQTS